MDNNNFDIKLSALVVRQNDQSVNTAANASAIKAIEAAIASITLAVENSNANLNALRQEVGEQRSLLASLRRTLFSPRRPN